MVLWARMLSSWCSSSVLGRPMRCTVTRDGSIKRSHQAPHSIPTETAPPFQSECHSPHESQLILRVWDLGMHVNYPRVWATCHAPRLKFSDNHRVTAMPDVTIEERREMFEGSDLHRLSFRMQGQRCPKPSLTAPRILVMIPGFSHRFCLDLLPADAMPP